MKYSAGYLATRLFLSLIPGWAGACGIVPSAAAATLALGSPIEVMGQQAGRAERPRAAQDAAVCPHCGRPLAPPPEVGSQTPSLPTASEGRIEQAIPERPESVGRQPLSPAGPQEPSSPTLRDDLGRLFSRSGVRLLSISLLLLIVLVAVYFALLRPYFKRRPLREAYAIINNNAENDFEKADKLISRALTLGLRKREIADARFAQAYVRTRLGIYEEASASLQELRKTTEFDRETAYLDLWLKIRNKKHEQAEKTCSRYQDLLEDFHQSSLLAGIAYLELGKKHWARNEIEAAMHFFEKVRSLKVLKEHLPKHIDDHQVVLGIMALLDNRHEEASNHFNGALESAKSEGKEASAAQLGLLLCKWREEDYPDIDAELGEILEVMNTASDSESAPDAAPEDTQIDDEEAPPGARDPSSEVDRATLLRNASLWHAISLIFTWFQLPEKGGLPEGEGQKLQQRLQRVIELDDEMPDPLLIRGLIDYFFAYKERRKEAVETLEQSLERGVNVPEVINLTNRENKLMEHEAKSLELFLNLLKKYLSDKSVPAVLQNELKERLKRFSRFKTLEQELQADQKEEVLPSIQDLQTRGQLLQRRIHNIVKPRMTQEGDDLEKIDKLINALEKSTATLAEETKQLETTEQKLMLRTGEFLFTEEERPVD